jgi:hypothetical protein
MLIEDYSFSRIIINGKEYTSDLLLCGVATFHLTC